MDKLGRRENLLRQQGFTEASKSRPRRRSDVKTRLVNGETLVLNRHEELVHQLNRTASYIWQRCDGQSTPKEIASQVCQAFEVDQSTALRDVLEIIQRLKQLNLLESP
jgi:hypothetical protein